MDQWKISLPKVSILIPTYNRPHYLKLALDSALAQTYPNIEIIIGDDSTNDETREMLQPYLKKYPFIKYLKRTASLPYDNMAECFQLASGEFINFLMDDDIFYPEKIAKMMDYFFEYSNVSLVTSYRDLIDENGNIIHIPGFHKHVAAQNTVFNGKELGTIFMRNGVNFIGEPTTPLFRKRDLPEGWANYQGIQYVALVDMASWLTLLTKGDFVYIVEPLSCFRIHSGQGNHSLQWQQAAYYEFGTLIHDSDFLDEHRAERAALIESYIQKHGEQFVYGISECTNPYIAEGMRSRYLEIFNTNSRK
ncbi:Glycosyltransferase involved in cell wall bisynthesis [Thermoactinomyces sp. DSM 45891]|uniref:glycosyltransferase family 2 protein n=1 Tax=Thermoactinomyces sp. DSM 45891 TaxID=1761907 RepID=UPI0009237099|nr:glycosyltransferase [Thermoactinomyces sp. DSM 45891]SFX72679.1 Glycosyltransferase involved in cell wall bisynthesis [Thermoactinomyces sp. DSM 45891]